VWHAGKRWFVRLLEGLVMNLSSLVRKISQPFIPNFPLSTSLSARRVSSSKHTHKLYIHL